MHSMDKWHEETCPLWQWLFKQSTGDLFYKEEAVWAQWKPVGCQGLQWDGQWYYMQDIVLTLWDQNQIVLTEQNMPKVPITSITLFAIHAECSPPASLEEHFKRREKESPLEILILDKLLILEIWRTSWRVFKRVPCVQWVMGHAKPKRSSRLLCS